MSLELLRSLTLGPAAFAQTLSVTHDVHCVQSGLSLVAAGSPSDATLTGEIDAFLRTAEGASEAEALRLAHTRIAPLIAALPQEAWGRSLRWFAQAPARDLLSPEKPMLRTRIDIEGDDPVLGKYIELSLLRTFEQLVFLSANHNRDALTWSHKLVKSGLLHQDRIHVKWRFLPRASSHELECRWHGPQRSGGLGFTLSLRRDRPLSPAGLAYVILSSYDWRNHFAFLRDTVVRKPLLRSPMGEKAVAQIDAFFEENGRHEALRAVAEIQRDLISGRGIDRIRKVASGWNFSQDMLNAIAEILRPIRLNIGIKTKSAGKTNRMRIYYERNEAAKQGKGDPRAFLNLTLILDPARRDAFSIERLWDMTAFSILHWIQEGHRTDSNIPLDAVLSQHTPTSFALHEHMPFRLAHPALSQEKALEYRDLFVWLGRFARKEEELGDFQSQLLSYERPSRIVWKDGGDSGTGVMGLARRDREGTSRPEFEMTGSLVDFLGWEPLQVFEALDGVVHSKDFADRPIVFRLENEPGQDPMKVWVAGGNAVTLSGGNSLRADFWTWVRLLWLHGKSTSDIKEPAEGLHILGGKRAREVAGRLAPALRRLSLTEPEVLEASVAERPTWFVDYSWVESAAGRPRPASVVSLLVMPECRLIHFNGQPRYEPAVWEKLARLLLRAPSGWTWLDPNLPWRTNRPELMASSQNRFYLVNTAYAHASTADQASYRMAFEVFSAQTEARGLKACTPLSSYDDLRALFGEICRRIHPDQAAEETDQEDLHRVKNAYEILKRFHKK